MAIYSPKSWRRTISIPFLYIMNDSMCNEIREELA